MVSYTVTWTFGAGTICPDAALKLRSIYTGLAMSIMKRYELVAEVRPYCVDVKLDHVEQISSALTSSTARHMEGGLTKDGVFEVAGDTFGVVSKFRRELCTGSEIGYRRIQMTFERQIAVPNHGKSCAELEFVEPKYSLLIYSEHPDIRSIHCRFSSHAHTFPVNPFSKVFTISITRSIPNLIPSSNPRKHSLSFLLIGYLYSSRCCDQCHFIISALVLRLRFHADVDVFADYGSVSDVNDGSVLDFWRAVSLWWIRRGRRIFVCGMSVVAQCVLLGIMKCEAISSVEWLSRLTSVKATSNPFRKKEMWFRTCTILPLWVQAEATEIMTIFTRLNSFCLAKDESLHPNFHRHMNCSSVDGVGAGRPIPTNKKKHNMSSVNRGITQRRSLLMRYTSGCFLRPSRSCASRSAQGSGSSEPEDESEGENELPDAGDEEGLGSKDDSGEEVPRDRTRAYPTPENRRHFLGIGKVHNCARQCPEQEWCYWRIFTLTISLFSLVAEETLANVRCQGPEMVGVMFLRMMAKEWLWKGTKYRGGTKLRQVEVAMIMYAMSLQKRRPMHYQINSLCRVNFASGLPNFIQREFENMWFRTGNSIVLATSLVQARCVINTVCLDQVPLYVIACHKKWTLTCLRLFPDLVVVLPYPFVCSTTSGSSYFFSLPALAPFPPSLIKLASSLNLHRTITAPSLKVIEKVWVVWNMLMQHIRTSWNVSRMQTSALDYLCNIPCQMVRRSRNETHLLQSLMGKLLDKGET
ncbi:uncharacterized protein BDR25DRAFT_351338 [Lindgomyces ingoldianus]|uniref:Uncharacterized protein n=1 Tax=Lindgomyces ingoldianus TaxID=673940 RepID=A0ACB6R7W0_9PLEO|nr:uncharacterized protein BDR25DRAFT_351338 [Lindgomyces ingoldianus]KAF2474835.1 hypothetical protein BDR25DRAFT_351338 [Lindgomyces ingoldianus]